MKHNQKTTTLNERLNRKLRGFTLIELLIVVAIIAILAAIAVPNFLEAQTRAKVSRVKADLRTLATALESYVTDFNDYPYYAETGIQSPLTTPIAYLSSDATTDPFNKGILTRGATGAFELVHQDYNYVSYNGDWGMAVASSVYGRTDGLGYKGFSVVGVGPDHQGQSSEVIGLPNEGYPPAWGPKVKYYYDPTNGTVSLGDIMRFGGQHYAPATSN